jgi:hypothetical protein
MDQTITCTDSPLLLGAFQLFASRRTRVVGPRPDLAIIQRIQFLCADGLISSAYLTTGACAFQAVGTVLFVWNAFFFPARFRNQAIAEILPNCPVFFQVDKNTDFAAVLVSHVPNAGRGFIVLQVGGGMPSSARRRF